MDGGVCWDPPFQTHSNERQIILKIYKYILSGFPVSTGSVNFILKVASKARLAGSVALPSPHKIFQKWRILGDHGWDIAFSRKNGRGGKCAPALTSQCHSHILPRSEFLDYLISGSMKVNWDNTYKIRYVQAKSCPRAAYNVCEFQIDTYHNTFFDFQYVSLIQICKEIHHEQYFIASPCKNVIRF